MAKTGNPVRVKLARKTVSFPPVCPHCLLPASVTIGIEESGRHFSGFYVFYTRWKYSTIQVPFCAEFGARLRTASTVCTAGFFVLIGLFILVVLAFEIALEGWQAALAVILIIGITWIPPMIVRPGTYIQLLGATEDSIEFEVSDADYAKRLPALNGVILPETETKPNGDNKSSAA